MMIKILKYPINYIIKRYTNIFIDIKKERLNIKEHIENAKITSKILLYLKLFFIPIKKLLIEIITIIIIIPIFIYLFVTIYSSPYIYNDINSIPKNDVALVLGTSKYLSNGKANMYFNFRMQAAHELYTNRKVKYILVSGDNRHYSYNEPKQMRTDLIKLGVPKENIFLDFAGFRTRDSIIRANKIFGLTNFTIVSQPFHNERAILIAREKGINAIAYNAKNVRLLYRIKQIPREIASRILMIVDIVINRPPHFYGEAIKIEERQKTNYKSNNINKYDTAKKRDNRYK